MLIAVAYLGVFATGTASPSMTWVYMIGTSTTMLAMMVLGAGGATAVCGVVVVLAPSADEWEAAAMLGIAGGILLLSAAAFLRLARAAGGAGTADALVSLALVGPYAANAAFCLLVWAGDAQLGWYLTVIPAAVALLELSVASLAAIRARRVT